MNTCTLQWEPCLLQFFGLRDSVLPKLVSTSEVYGHIASGILAGVPIGGLVGDQQGAMVGNKCLRQGEAKCTYGTGAFLLFCTGEEQVKSSHGLLSTVSIDPLPRCILLTTLLPSLRLHSNLVQSRNPFTPLKEAVCIPFSCPITVGSQRTIVGSAGSAITWLKDSMNFISKPSEVNDLAAQEPTSGGVYFVTAFSGLLAPYWDSSAAGLMIGKI